VALDLDQSISIEFFPAKYGTTSLTEDMYSQQFNNLIWMATQLSSAQKVLKMDEGSEDMIVWAEMQYGGVAEFLESAEVSGTEGVQSLPIDPAVYNETQEFINSTLPDFLSFSDMDLRSRIVEEMIDGFLSDSGVKELLSELED
jgi:hypothetical protein